ncbi:GntR family transcriptional regulator [Escherichia coli]
MAENQSTVENAKEKLDRWLKRRHHHAGWKTPFRRELGELLGIKRMTLRQALLNLEAESKIFHKDREGVVRDPAAI